MKEKAVSEARIQVSTSSGFENVFFKVALMWAVTRPLHLCHKSAGTFATSILVKFLNDVVWTHTSQGK